MSMTAAATPDRAALAAPRSRPSSPSTGSPSPRRPSPPSAALAVLVADLFLPERRKRLLGWLTVAGLLLAALALLSLRDGDRAHLLPARRRPTRCSYAADRFALVIQFLVLGGALLTALLSMPAMTATEAAGRASTGSCCCPPPPAPPCCPPPATWSPSSSPWRSPRCRLRAGRAAARTPAPRRRPR